MKNTYLTLAIVGAIIPYLFFFDFIQTSGFDIPLFVVSTFANGAAGGFSADLYISSFVFWLFMFQRGREVNGPHPWLFVLLNLTTGLSCALPAYLFAVEKRREAA